MANEDNRKHPTTQNFSPSSPMVQSGVVRPNSSVMMPNITLGQMNRASILRSHQQQMQQFPGGMAAAQPNDSALHYTSNNQLPTWHHVAPQQIQNFGYFQPAQLAYQAVSNSGALARRPQQAGGYSAPIGLQTPQQQIMGNLPQTSNIVDSSNLFKSDAGINRSGLLTPPQSKSSIDVFSHHIAGPSNKVLFGQAPYQLDLEAAEANERLSAFATQFAGPCNYQRSAVFPAVHHNNGLQPWTQTLTLAQIPMPQANRFAASGSSPFKSSPQTTFTENQVGFVDPKALSIHNEVVGKSAASGPSPPAHIALQNQVTINGNNINAKPAPEAGSGLSSPELAVATATPPQGEAFRRRRLTKSRSLKVDRRSVSPRLSPDSPRSIPSPDGFENMREATPPGAALRKNGKPRTTNRRVGTLRAGSCVKCKRDKSKCVKPDGAESCISCEKKGIPCDWNVIDNRTNRANLEIFKAEVEKYKERLLSAQNILHLLKPSQIDTVLGQNAYELVGSWEQGPDEAMTNLKRKLPDLVHTLPALIYTPELVEAENKANGWEYDTTAKLKDKRVEKLNIEARSRIHLDGIAADIRQILLHYKEGAHDLAEKIIVGHIGTDNYGSKASLVAVPQEENHPIVIQSPVMEQQALMVEEATAPIDIDQALADPLPEFDDHLLDALLGWDANNDQNSFLFDQANAPDSSLLVEVQQPFLDIPAQIDQPVHMNLADSNFDEANAQSEDYGELDALIHAGLDESQAQASEAAEPDMAEIDRKIDALFEESEDANQLSALLQAELDTLQAQTAESEDVEMVENDPEIDALFEESEDDNELSALLHAELDQLQAQMAESEDVDMVESEHEIDALSEENEGEDELSALLHAELDKLQAQAVESEDVNMIDSDSEIDALSEESEEE